MEVRLLELPIRGFGADPTAAQVELDVLSPADRLSGPCPYCGVQQGFTVMGQFRLPKKLYCEACQRQLMLEGSTT
jgi:hypothetical protein